MESSTSHVQMIEQQFQSRLKELDCWLEEVERRLTVNVNSSVQDDFEDPEKLEKRIESNGRIISHLKKETRDKLMGLISVARTLAKEPTFDETPVKYQCHLITKKFSKISNMAKDQRSQLNEAVDRVIQKLIRDMDDLGMLLEERRNFILNSDPDPDSFNHVDRLIKSNMEESFSAIQLLENRAANLSKVLNSRRANIQSTMNELQEKYTDLCELFSRRHEWFQIMSQINGEERWIGQKQELLEEVGNSSQSRESNEDGLKKLDKLGSDLLVHFQAVNEIEEKLASFKGTTPERVLKLKYELEQFKISVVKRKQETTMNIKSFKFYYQAYLTRNLINDKEKESATFNAELKSVHEKESLGTIQTKQDEFDLELQALENGGVATLRKIKEYMVEGELIKCDLINKTFSEIVSRWESLVSSNQERKRRIKLMHDAFTKIADESTSATSNADVPELADNFATISDNHAKPVNTDLPGRCSVRLQKRSETCLENDLIRQPPSQCLNYKKSNNHILQNPKDKRFQCDLCGISYTAYTTLWSHKKKFHPKKIGACSSNPIYEPERIIRKRTVRGRAVQYLVQFKGRPETDNLWTTSGAIDRSDLVNEFEDHFGDVERAQIFKKRSSMGSNSTGSSGEDQDQPNQMAAKKMKPGTLDEHPRTSTSMNIWCRNRIPEKITGVKAGPGGSSLFVLKLKDTDDTIMVRETFAKSKYPQLVSVFYEAIIKES